MTEENVGKYDIHDVVMPMAGYDVQLPLNDGMLDIPTWLVRSL